MLCLFAPVGKDRDRYESLHGKIKYPEVDILIGSDAISVGHNLQDADCIANIDLPYNPMVIEQRIGRIDRPKSEGAADVINIHYFYSAKIIELETRLIDILDRKLRQIYVDTQYDSDLLPHLSEEFYLALKEDQLEKSNEILEKISSLIPIKIETKKVKIKIPAVHTGRAYGVVAIYKVSENWLDDGSLEVIVEVPSGMIMDFYDKLNGVTHGSALTEEIKE